MQEAQDGDDLTMGMQLHQAALAKGLVGLRIGRDGSHTTSQYCPHASTQKFTSMITLWQRYRSRTCMNRRCNIPEPQSLNWATSSLLDLQKDCTALRLGVRKRWMRRT
jgi:hypothetical protein